MSIPLDRLYDFLGSINCHNLLIYDWRVHGSKNLKNFDVRNPIPTDWRERKTQPLLIFHDQEPLDYDFYQYQIDHEFCNLTAHWDDFLLITAPLIQEFYKTTHLRGMCHSSSALYDLCLITHSEKNSPQLDKFEKNGFVPVYYWSHYIISRDWFRFAEHDQLLKHKAFDPKTFLIYNRAWSGTREYRLKFIEQLIDSGLHQNCITKFAELDNNIHYTDHVFKNIEFKLARYDLEKILSKNTHNSIASADYNRQDYQHSLIEVVLETLFDDVRHHLTEKSLRPIACAQPFILAATPGSLQYLRDYGFQTFDGYIDETYDTIQDPSKRLQAIVSEMQRIDQMSPESKTQLIAGVQAAVDHNQRLFFSQEFHSRIVDEFKQNLNSAVATVKAGPVGNTWKQVRNIAQEQYPDLFLKFLNQDTDDINWAEQWIQSHVKS